MGKVPAARVDLVRDSKGFLLGIAFRETRAREHADAIARAQASDRYVEIAEGKVKAHAALFSESLEAAERAIDLLGIVQKWPGTQVFAKGRLITNMRDLRRMLECYLESFRVRDYRAHCHKIVSEPGFDQRVARIWATRLQLYSLGKSDAWVEAQLPNSVEVQRYVHPCALIAEDFTIDEDHPSAAADQVQAHAVRACADLCPRFRPEDYKITGKPVRVST